MKLNNVQKIKICQKALFAKQLQQSALLCSVYQKLAQHYSETKDGVTSEDVEQKYSQILHAIAYKDTEMEIALKRSNAYSKEELDLFDKYSKISEHFFNYQKASEYLSSSINSDKTINSDSIDKFHRFMQSKNGSEAYFDNHIKNYTSNFIGKYYYGIAKKSLSLIKEVDNSYLENFSSDIDQHLTLDSFTGSSLVLKSPSIHTQHLLNQPNLEQQFHSTYSVHDKKKYSRTITPIDKSINSAYVLGKITEEEFIEYCKNNKAAPKKILAIIVATAVGGATLVSAFNSYKNSQLSGIENQENGLNTYVTPETLVKLSTLKNLIDNAKSSELTPSENDLRSIIDQLDTTNTLVVKDLTIDAFSKSNPNYTNISATPSFSSNSVDGRQDVISINYTNENNEEQSIVIDKFDADIRDSFNDEASYSTLYNELENIYSNPSTDYVEKAKEVKSFIKKLNKIFENIDNLAGKEFKYSDGVLMFSPSLKTKRPSKVEATEKEDYETTTIPAEQSIEETSTINISNDNIHYVDDDYDRS